MLHPLEEKRDMRGSFTEFLCDSWDLKINPVQWSLVKSVRGTLRGMHLHWRHDEFFYLAGGHCCVGLRDVRSTSTTRNVFCLLEFTEQDPAVVSFPRGILHGWYFFTDSFHIQAISDEEYARYYADDNHGCHWSDPAIEIPWPHPPTIVSERANRFPDLASLLRSHEGR
jgi:dTDP-4-dehydrorhamnose 3,5-epimerase